MHRKPSPVLLAYRMRSPAVLSERTLAHYPRRTRTEHLEEIMAAMRERTISILHLYSCDNIGTLGVTNYYA